MIRAACYWRRGAGVLLEPFIDRPVARTGVKSDKRIVRRIDIADISKAADIEHSYGTFCTQ